MIARSVPLSREAIEEMHTARTLGLSYREIGERFGCTSGWAWMLINDKRVANSGGLVFRKQAIAKLGGKCTKCGFADIRALQIDHVTAIGGKKRKRNGSSYQYYKQILEQTDTGKFQVLCANCNCIKRVENKENRNQWSGFPLAS